ncbi:ribonuclease J [bacterium]|nr:ribonuclease J [bacterium]
MSTGEHRHIKMKEQDTVILSSTPIPETGNDAKIADMVDDLERKNVHVFQHTTHDLDGVGPLHVSGHASIDEYAEMINVIKPKFFIPIYGSFRSKKRHIDIAINEGIPRANTLNVENGQVVELTKDTMILNGEVPNGSVLVDQNGYTINNVVVKDRVLLSEEGLVAIILTVDKKTGQLLSSPDIISRGFIYMRDNEEIMNGLRTELKRAVAQRYKRIDLDRFKQELKDHVTHYLFEKTQGSPIVIPVINLVGSNGNSQPKNENGKEVKPKTNEEIVADQQKRFQEMRERLLSQDAAND